jgi:hypothetical protein
MSKIKLKSMDEIFSEAWLLYKSRALPMIVVMLLTSLLSIALIGGSSAAAYLGLGIEQGLAGDLRELLLNPMVIGSAIGIFFLTILLILWSQAAVLAITVDEELSILGAMLAGWKFFLPMLWVGCLYFGIVLAGLSLFVLPGLILALSLSLCFFIMIDEEFAGIDAVMASRLYIRGHWWNTFFKFLLVWLISIVLSLIPVAGQVLAVLFAPFMLLYMVAVYRDLKRVANDTVDPNTCFRWLWVLLAAAGIVLPLLGFIGAAVTLGPQLPDMIQQLREQGTDYIHTVSAPPALPGPVATPPPGPAAQHLTSVDGFMVWRDPVGDTGNPLLDIKEVSAGSEDGELVLSVTMAQSFDSYFTAAGAASFDPLVSFFLDTDDDPVTGGSSFSDPERTGYDMAVDVQLSAHADEQHSGQPFVSLYRLSGSNRQSLGSVAESAVSVSGHILKISLPHSQLTLDGNVVRVCYREANQQQGSGMAKDKRVPLQ